MLMPSPAIGGEGVMFPGRPVVRPLSFIDTSRDVISLYLVDGFQWNLTQIFIIWVDIAENVFKVKGQGRMCTNVWMLQRRVVSRLACLLSFLFTAAL